jgi:hypothetical protein
MYHPYKRRHLVLKFQSAVTTRWSLSRFPSQPGSAAPSHSRQKHTELVEYCQEQLYNMILFGLLALVYAVASVGAEGLALPWYKLGAESSTALPEASSTAFPDAGTSCTHSFPSWQLHLMTYHAPAVTRTRFLNQTTYTLNKSVNETTSTRSFDFITVNETTSTRSFDFITVNGTTFIRPSSTSYYSRSTSNIAPTESSSHSDACGPSTTGTDPVKVFYPDETHHEDVSFTLQPTAGANETEARGGASKSSMGYSDGPRSTGGTSEYPSTSTHGSERPGSTAPPRSEQTSSEAPSGGPDSSGDEPSSFSGKTGTVTADSTSAPVTSGDVGFSDLSTSIVVSIPGEGEATPSTAP